MASRAVVHLRGPPVGRGGPRGLGDQRRHFVLGQALQRDRVPPGSHPDQGLGDRLGQLVVPVGPDDHQRHRPVGLGDEPQQRERGRVGPLQVVEDDEGGRVPSEPLQELGDRVEQAQPRHLRVDRRLLGCARPPGQLGQEARELDSVL